MFKSRAKQCEEEAKKEQEYDYVPTKDLEVDETKLEKEELPEKKKFPWVPVIVMGTIVILMIVCVIVIMCMGGPISTTSK